MAGRYEKSDIVKSQDIMQVPNFLLVWVMSLRTKLRLSAHDKENCPLCRNK